MSTHTPGPWHRNIKPATKYNTVWSGRNTHVARVVTDGLTEEEVEANIALVAAAPDLLAALQNLQASPNDPRAHRVAFDVIAKATGASA